MSNKKFDDEFPPAPFFVRTSDVQTNRSNRTLFVLAILHNTGSSCEVERRYGMSIKTGSMFMTKPPYGTYSRLEKRKSDAMWSAAGRALKRERDRILDPQLELVLEN